MGEFIFMVLLTTAVVGCVVADATVISVGFWVAGVVIALAMIGVMNLLGQRELRRFTDVYFVSLFGIVFAPILAKDTFVAFQEWRTRPKAGELPSQRVVN